MNEMQEDHSRGNLEDALQRGEGVWENATADMTKTGDRSKEQEETFGKQITNITMREI